MLPVAVSRKGRAPIRRSSAKELRDRLDEAEATLDAIRTGQVDALVVSGPGGEQTLTLEGATHPYFVLLNAMGDGAALLEPSGAVLFCNRSLGQISGVPVHALRGSMFQGLVSAGERSSFEELLREGSAKNAAREFGLLTGNGSVTPVLIGLSALPLGTSSRVTGPPSNGSATVLMAIVTDLSYRKAAEATRARLLERVIVAEDDERRRVARELHDETGQSLAAILIGLRAIAEMVAPSRVRKAALRLRDVAAQTVDDVGRLARGLHPAVLDDMGLSAAAKRYVDDYVRSFGTTMDFVADDLDSPRLSPVVAATMYRILQEALTNVARHARARNVSIALTCHDGLELLVRDDGVGFDLKQQRGDVTGFGLRGMRERVALLGGAMEIDSRPGRGTVVRARIPTPPPPAKNVAVGRAKRVRKRSQS